MGVPASDGLGQSPGSRDMINQAFGDPTAPRVPKIMTSYYVTGGVTPVLDCHKRSKNCGGPQRPHLGPTCFG